MKDRTRPFALTLFLLCVLTLLVGGRLHGDADSWFRNAPLAPFAARSAYAVSLISAAFLFYLYVLLRKPRPENPLAISSMDAGLKWGLGVGCLWLIGLFIEPAAWFLALLLPPLGGAIGAAGTGRLRDGSQTGLWCGISGGMLGFLVFATAANIALIFPTLTRIDPDELVFALWILILYGPIYCPITATIGGLIGILLERTGRLSPSKIVSS